MHAHRLLLFLLGSIFATTLYWHKYKYQSTKRYKGVDRQLLIMNRTSAGTREASISGVKGHSWMITWSHHHCQEKQLCPSCAHCCSGWPLHQPLFWNGAIACAAMWWVIQGNRSMSKRTLPFLPSAVCKTKQKKRQPTHQPTLSKFELRVEERSGMHPSKMGNLQNSGQLLVWNLEEGNRKQIIQ